MTKKNYLFTSESVSEGHPDKVCDIISDSIVDSFLSQSDPENSRVAIETLVTTNKVVLSGEVRGPSGFECPYEDITRNAIKNIGYEQEKFHWKNVSIDVNVHSQSADIAQGVDAGGNKDQGAGDQGLMFGYACDETNVLMPAAIHYSHKILHALAKARKSGDEKLLEPDSKSQITLLYENDKPVKASSVVVSTQHSSEIGQSDVRKIVQPYVEEILPEGWMCSDNEFYVNPTGKFVIGGPDGDTGLTGRKIIVDTYGGSSPHGGGAFSGKDPTKVDRSAAYACRYLAKNIVAAKIAKKCTIQIAYAIGVSKPISLYVNNHGTSNVDERKLEKVLQEIMDLSPRGIREHLNLHRPIYTRTAAYGHFGRNYENDGGFSWEKTDLIEQLLSVF